MEAEAASDVADWTRVTNPQLVQAIMQCANEYS
jgi:hypothetical protein